MDKFHEQLLRTKKSPSYKLMQFSMNFSIILIVLVMGTTFAALNFFTMIFLVLLTASAFAARFLRDRQFKEYEYIFTNGNLQIDVIFNMKKRKTLYDIDVKNFEDFGKATEVNITNGTKRVVCIPWDNKEERYVFLSSEKGKQAVYIAPNAEILKHISIYAVKRNKY